MSDVMRLNTLSPAPGSRKDAKRVGRGIGSGNWARPPAAATRARSPAPAAQVRPGFEGGQMPLQKRLPKYGFTSRIARTTAQVRLGELNAVDGDSG